MALNSVLTLFAPSPMRTIQTHMEIVLSAARELMPFVEDVSNEDWDAATEHFEIISRLANTADQLKRDLHLHLPKGLLLPVSRTDLTALITVQDGIANHCEDIAALMLDRKILIPKKLVECLGKFLHNAIDATIQASKTINELDELLETGFSISEIQLVENMIHKLDEIKTESDHFQINLHATLFTLEKELNPVDVIFLYQIIKGISDITNQAQQIGERLLLLLAHGI